ncbi:MAG: CoA-binding protein [Promethearchaeota archaeon]
MIDFEKLFNPRGIGIIGVNDKLFGGGYFYTCYKNLGYEGSLYLFNPRMKGKELGGHRIYSSILEIDEPIDYVIIAVPAKIVPQVLEECGQKGVPFVTIFTSGFSEVGNKDLELEILQIAKKHDVRIIGPNCLGVYVPKNKMAISLTLLKGQSGNMGMIFQSGGLSVYVAAMGSSVYGTHPSKVISIGNQIDLTFVDFLRYFKEDKETNFVAMYLENIKSVEIGRKFIESVKELSLEGKPVIIWKVGSGKASQEAIMSHTGGLSGSLKIWEAMSKQTGGILVRNSHELINLAMLFQHISSMPINRNMAITAVGGGASIETTDVFERYNLLVPKLDPTTVQKLKEFLPDVNTIFRNPLDLGGSGADPEILAKTLITLDSDPNISAVIFIKVYDFNHKFLESIKQAYIKMKKPLICIAYKVVDETSDYAGKLFFKKELFKMKVPVFESIELAAKSLDKMCNYREFLSRQETAKKEMIFNALL